MNNSNIPIIKSGKMLIYKLYDVAYEIDLLKVGLLSSTDLAAEMKEQFNQFFGLEEAFAKH